MNNIKLIEDRFKTMIIQIRKHFMDTFFGSPNNQSNSLLIENNYIVVFFVDLSLFKKTT